MKVSSKKNSNSVLWTAIIFWFFSTTILSTVVVCAKSSKNYVKGNWCKSQLPFCFWRKCKRVARRQAFFVKVLMELDVDSVPFSFNDSPTKTPHNG